MSLRVARDQENAPGKNMKIVALSDQHGFLPDIERCDLLIIAGDICPDRIGESLARHNPARQKAWFDRHVRPWLATSRAAHKILTWGNHDWCGQACSFAEDAPATATSTVLQIVVDEAVSVPAAAGMRSVSIWASPWSHQFDDWAFMKPRADLAEIYAAIPARVDILVSHEPPFGLGDCCRLPSGDVAHVGSRELLAAIERVRPRLVICGHLHEGHGRFDFNGSAIYNVSIVNEDYELVRSPTVIDIADW